jgi:simple sugar transport system permease protein
MKIQPMVATLILFTAGRGMAQLITGGNQWYVKVESFKFLGNSIPGVPLPTPIFVAILAVIITVVFLKKTALGMYIEAVGINSKASRLVGLNSVVIQFLTYAFCGLCAGIAGLIITSRIGSIDGNNAGLNMELDAILAVALGGNSLGGGKFSIAGSVIGAITIQALTTSLYAMKVTADQLPVYKAVVVIIIVALQSPELQKIIKQIKSKTVNQELGKKVA